MRIASTASAGSRTGGAAVGLLPLGILPEFILLLVGSVALTLAIHHLAVRASDPAGLGWAEAGFAQVEIRSCGDALCGRAVCSALG